MPPAFHLSTLSVPEGFEQDAAESGAFVFLLFIGLFSGAALFGALGGFALVEAARELHRRYQILTRKGYYGYERRRDEAQRQFEEAVADIHRNPGETLKRYGDALRAYYDELGRIDEEQRRESERNFRWRGATVRTSPRAEASRERRRTKRRARWRKWAESFAEAMRLGREPPAPPSGRRGNGGAPIRRLCERSVSPPPKPEELVAQWERARGRAPAEEKIRLGSMMLDIEATVDSSLVRNTDGEIVGRRPGIRGWLRENCPALAGHYRVLMDCRRLADDFRRAHGLRDPHPAALLLGKEPPKSLPTVLRKMLKSRRAAAQKLLASAAGRNAATLAEALAKSRAGRDAAPMRRRTG